MQNVPPALFAQSSYKGRIFLIIYVKKKLFLSSNYVTYTGMTRAKQRLFLCRALKRHWFGKTENFEISPFLARIEENLLTLSKYERERKEKEPVSQLSLF